MVSREYLQMMALYNQWQNKSLYSICDTLGEEGRNRDRGMFFGSIHRTLDHIGVINDALWFLIEQGEPKSIDFQAIRFSDFSQLRKDTFAFDKKLLDLAETCDESWLAGIISFYSSRLGRERRLPRAFYFLQMFNHQTHHRSQITSELHKLGIDYGNTDLPYNPYLKN